MRSHVKGAAALAALLWLVSPARAAEVTMTITSPAEGKTAATTYFSARLSGLTEPVVVRVDCAGATHFIMARPLPPEARPMPGRPPREPVAYDSWLPIVPGKQELTATVLSQDGKEIVPKTKVTFTVEPASDEAIAKGNYGLSRVYDELNGSAEGLYDAWQWFPGGVEVAASNSTTEERDAALRQIESYTAARANEFHVRLKAYADLAEVYLAAGRPADAMRAAQEADRIYEAEKGTVTEVRMLTKFPVVYDPRPAQTVGSPAHFGVTAKLYGMKGDLNGALSWYEKAIAFQVAQARHGHLNADARKRCMEEAATACRQAAQAAFLMTNDMAKQKQWLDRADRIAAGSSE